MISVPEDHVKEIKKLIYHFSCKGKHLLEEDILTVGDLFFRRVNRDPSPTDRFNLMGIMDAVPVEWRKRVKQSAHYTRPELRNKVKIKIDDASFDLSLVTPKSLYNAFKIAKQTPPSAQKRFQDQFPDVQFDWNEIRSPLKCR